MVSSCAQPSKTSYQLASILEWQQRGIPMGKGWWAKISFRPAFNPSSSAHVADVVWRVPPGHVAGYPRTERKEYIVLNGKNFPGFMLSRIGEVCTLLAKMLVDIFHQENYVQYSRRISRSSSMFLLLVREKWKKRDAEMANNCCEFLQETDEPSVQILLRGSVDWKRDWKFVGRNWKVAGEIWPRTNIGRQMDEERPRTGDWNWQTDVKKYPVKPDRLKSACTSYDAFYFFFSPSPSLLGSTFCASTFVPFPICLCFFFLFLEKSSRAKVEIDRFEQFLILKYIIRKFLGNDRLRRSIVFSKCFYFDLFFF